MVGKRWYGLGESPHGLDFDLDLDLGAFQVLSISLDLMRWVLICTFLIQIFLVVAEMSIICTLFAQYI